MATSETRRRWLAPAVAGATALAVAGGVVAYTVSRPGTGTAPASSAASATPAAHSPDDPPDVCSMISASEAERLAPRAVIDRTASDDSSATAWKCRWRGDLLPGENGSAGEIEIEVKRYKKTGESAEVVAARKYAFAVQGDQSLATRSHKEFVDAPVRRFSGIGDSAHGQYSRSRTGSGYDVAKGSSRVGDVIVGVQYRPGGSPAPPLPRGDIPPAAERAALREAESLLRQVSESVTDWRAGRPYARPATPAATPAPTGTPAPAATPTPVPVDFAANCAKFGLAAARLVPDPKTGASRTVLSDRTVVDCWWENADLPASRGLRLRNVSISVLTFTNRAGNPDPEGARRHYEERRDRALRRARDGVDREYPGISFTEVTDLPGTDDPAYVQYRRHRAAELQVGVAGVLVVVGGSVIEVSYAGSERPRGAGIGSARSVLMPEREARAAVAPLARAIAGIARR
ncbi:hypothetical protein [Planobispora longispora]|uniref:DUF3558 domain-containing protein n=1 Tax=Planobispora longispora TaxID=28887 RepID=A0A8J3RL80_9ACTN|nr:hypothetical protein [Planobispora longispora]GIH78581.1 hypothetical protein Plo01_50100 [Planobispora longispora]